MSDMRPSKPDSAGSMAKHSTYRLSSPYGYDCQLRVDDANNLYFHISSPPSSPGSTPPSSPVGKQEVEMPRANAFSFSFENFARELDTLLKTEGIPGVIEHLRMFEVQLSKAPRLDSCFTGLKSLCTSVLENMKDEDFLKIIFSNCEKSPPKETASGSIVKMDREDFNKACRLVLKMIEKCEEEELQQILRPVQPVKRKRLHSYEFEEGGSNEEVPESDFKCRKVNLTIRK